MPPCLSKVLSFMTPFRERLKDKVTRQAKKETISSFFFSNLNFLYRESGESQPSVSCSYSSSLNRRQLPTTKLRESDSNHHHRHDHHYYIAFFCLFLSLRLLFPLMKPITKSHLFPFLLLTVVRMPSCLWFLRVSPPQDE
jgi:hypothetical protein